MPRGDDLKQLSSIGRQTADVEAPLFCICAEW